MRPLPWQSRWAPVPRCRSARVSPVSSEARSPVVTPTWMRARSRRPVLVVGRDQRTLLGLMLSSQDYHRDDPDWISIGVGTWDYDGRPSWVRLDRVLDVPEEGIRREGAILDRQRFESVAIRLRAEYSWS